MGREREILSEKEREEEGREREVRQRGNQRQKEGEVQERNHTCINLDKTGLVDCTGNVICLPGCNVKSMYLKMSSWKCIL